jgi:hypothetical protein
MSLIPNENEVHYLQSKESERLSGARGDARRLDFSSGSADGVLLLGPLYHLVEHADRLQALR